MGKKLIFLAVVATSLLYVEAALAAGPKLSESLGVNSNKHNLSSKSANTYKAAVNAADPSQRDTQICIFCHTPHNSSPQGALWNRNDITVSFGRYSSATLVIRNFASAKYAEPNGSSRLCLSCHDGVTALGMVKNGAQIFMQGGQDKLTGIAVFDAKKVKLGHHPVSFVYNDQALLDALNLKTGLYAGTYRFPTNPAVPADVTAVVKLDKLSRMQCATCHDPHQNQSLEDVYPSSTRKIAPFWVFHENNPLATAVSDHDAVCKACHPFTNYDPAVPTRPWPSP